MSPGLLLELVWLLAGAFAILVLARWWRPALSWRLGAAYFLLTLLFFAPAFNAGGFDLATDLASQWLPWREAIGERVTPQNALLADPVLQMLPFRALVRGRLLRLEPPLWAHELGTGQPLLGNAQSAPFAPLHLLALALPPLRAMSVAAALQVFLALLLTHLLLRRLGASQAGAALAALGFAFSTFSIAWLHYPLSTTACWLPGVLLGLLLLRDGARGGAVGLVVCGCGMALGGHPETLAHATLSALAITVWLVASAPARRWAFAGRAVAVAALVGCLTAPALLPIAESILGSERIAQLQSNPAAVAPPRFEPRTLGLLIDPLFYGSPRDGNWSGPGNFNESATAYGGFLVLMLAAAGALAGGRRVAAVAAGGLVALLIALDIAPFPRLLAPFIIFEHAANARLRFVWILGLAVAAGLTVDRLANDRRVRRVAAFLIAVGGLLLLLFPPPSGAAWERSWWIATLSGACAILAGLALPATRRFVAAGACVLVAIDLALLGVRYNPTPGLAFDLAPPPALRFMMGRVQATGPPLRVAALGWDLMPNLAALYGLADPRGNDPTRPARAARFVGERLGGGYVPGSQVRLPEHWLDQGALNYLGVRFLLTRHSRELPEPWRLAFEGEGGRVWENPNALPLFFLPRRREVAANAKSALRRALATVEFSAFGLVEGGDGASRSQQGGVSSIQRQNDGYEVTVDSATGGLVVSSVSSTPGWTAAAAGRALPVQRVNGAFLGFDVPRGRTQVRLRYQPLGWRLGRALFAIGGLTALAWVAYRRYRPAAHTWPARV